MPYAIHMLPYQKVAGNPAVRFLSAAVKAAITKTNLWRREFNGIVIKNGSTSWAMAVCVLLRGKSTVIFFNPCKQGCKVRGVTPIE